MSRAKTAAFAMLDWGGTLLLALVFVPFRVIARRRYWLPRFSALSDRVGLHLLTSHYYEPTYAEADRPAVTTGERPLPAIDFNAAGQLALLARFTFQCELEAIPAVKARPAAYGYSSASYGPGDAEIAYNMVRLHKPRLIIEIGSGDSTLITRAAIAANAGEDPAYLCEQVCIEPYEQPWLETIGVDIRRQRVETIELALFDRLAPGDILLIDSSHVIRPWGDVLREFHEIIPRLKPGVLVHVHDIFTPRDYPEAWLRVQRRLWTEQYLLEAYLAFNPRAEVICAANWLKHNHFDALARACPMMARHPDAEPGAFWFITR